MNIWEGVYEHMAEVPTVGPGFRSETYLRRSEDELRAALSKVESNHRGVSDVHPFGRSLLPVVLAMADEGSNQSIRVLDFGGGVGLTFLTTTSCLGKGSGKLEYHVVDNADVCAVGRKVLGGDPRIIFHSRLPEKIGPLDVLHIGSSLQYVEDWKETLARLGRLGARLWVFTDLYAGGIPTYATAQTYYESRIPCWYFSLDEVMDIVESSGYELLHRSAYIGKILGEFQGNPQENFPAEFRLGHACNLIFRKRG